MEGGVSLYVIRIFNHKHQKKATMVTLPGLNDLFLLSPHFRWGLHGYEDIWFVLLGYNSLRKMCPLKDN